MSFLKNGAITAALAGLLMGPALAQAPAADVASPPPTNAAAPAPTAAPTPAAVAAPTAIAAPGAPPAAGLITIPEGTEVFIRIEDRLSSATNAAGDRFAISLDEEIDLGGGRVIPAGYRGVGEVTHAQKRGFMGKAGELNVNLNYIRIGDTRLRLRGSRNREGEGRLGTTVVLTVLFGPLGLLWKGKDIEVPSGQRIPAYIDTDAQVTLPAPPPPRS